MKSVVIIGSGNLAQALALAVDKSELTLRQIFARNAARAREVAELTHTTWASDPVKLAEADVYLIAVSDKAVAEVASTLPIPAAALIVHTAGSVPLDALPAKFLHRGVFYPLQTFTQGREVDFSQIPVFLEASDSETSVQLEALARELTHTIYYADSVRRAKVHLAGVFACNFANHMFAAGEQIIREAELPFAVLKPLIVETSAKAVAAASPTSIQTGPAIRGDMQTQARHAAMLAENPQLKNIYSNISQNIWETSKKI